MILRSILAIAALPSAIHAVETYASMLERALYDSGSTSCQMFELIPEHQYFDQHCPHVFHHVPCASQELSDRFIGKMRELFGGQSTIDSWTEAAKWRGTETLSTVAEKLKSNIFGLTSLKMTKIACIIHQNVFQNGSFIENIFAQGDRTG